MIGKELRKRRNTLGMTQETLAKELDVTANTVARWERGEVPRGGGPLPSWVDKVLKQIESEKLSKSSAKAKRQNINSGFMRRLR